MSPDSWRTVQEVSCGVTESSKIRYVEGKCATHSIAPVWFVMPSFCLVRQPVFGANGVLLGYEIRFRNAEDGQHAFSQSFLTGSFDVARANLPAFLVATREQLLDDAFQMGDPANAILLLPPDLLVDDDVVHAVARHRERGGTIVLDGLTDAVSPSEALLPQATWVRMDVRLLGADELSRVCARVVGTGATRARTPRLLAGYVSDQTQYAATTALKFDAFQGMFFSRAEPLPAADLPSTTVSAMRLMGLARNENVKDRELEDVISTDPVLTFQLLRLVNSAATGLRGVSSIGQALRLIGRSAFMRWMAVAVAASRRSTNGVDQELVRHAVERGRLLEQLAGGPREAGTLFLVGLFSLLDSVFRMPLPEIVSRVALSDDATAALLEGTGPYADALAFADSYELGMFEHAQELATAMHVDPAKLNEFYTTAMAWTAETLSPSLEGAARA